MKKIFVLFIFLASIPVFPQQLPRLTTGIFAGAGMIGKKSNHETENSQEKKPGGYNYQAGIYADVKFWKTNWYNGFVLSASKSGGVYKYDDGQNVYKNTYQAISPALMFQIGGVVNPQNPEAMKNIYICYFAAGVGSDIYTKGPFSRNTGNFETGNRAWMWYPVFGIGVSSLWKNLTLNICELTLDFRRQEQPQQKFNRERFRNLSLATGIGISIF